MAASNYGKIDFRRQVIMLLPPILRSISVVDWLSSLVKPLDTVMDDDWDYIYSQYIKGHLTGQKMVMQEGLNFLFGITISPFIIVETSKNEGTTLYAFNEAEGTTSYIYNEAEGTTVYVLNESEAVQPGGTDFIVKMPTVYASPENVNRLIQQVDILKVVGTTYQIITY